MGSEEPLIYNQLVRSAGDHLDLWEDQKGSLPDANKIECVKQDGVIGSVLSFRAEYDENALFVGFLQCGGFLYVVILLSVLED